MKVKSAIAVFCVSCAVTLGQGDTDLWTKYREDLRTNRQSSVTLFRMGELYLLQHDYLSAANTFREALNGDLQPKWIEVWSHINLGKVFDLTGQRERALNEYRLALRTKDDTRGALEEATIYQQFPYPRTPPPPDDQQLPK
jgi:tetratricopeptide (TPR) repeat protein